MPDYYPISKIVGKKITYYRKMKGISLTELAKVTGVSEQQQSRYERGINRINLSRLYLYANFFNINVQVFLQLSEDEINEINVTEHRTFENNLF